MQIGGIGDTAFGDKSPSFFSFRGVSKMKKGTRENKIGWGGANKQKENKKAKVLIAYAERGKREETQIVLFFR